MTRQRERVPFWSRWSKAWQALTGSYELAEETTQNQHSFVNAPTAPPAIANSPTVRQTRRNRMRYEFDENPYLQGMVRQVAKDTVNTGPRLQLLIADRFPDTEEGRATAKRIATDIEKKFGDWCKRIRLGRKLRIVKKNRMYGNEAFAIFRSGRAIFGPDGTVIDQDGPRGNRIFGPAIDLQLIDEERVNANEWGGFNFPETVYIAARSEVQMRIINREEDAEPGEVLIECQNIDGVFVTLQGDIPIAYLIQRSHPGADHIYSHLPPDERYELVPARFVAHLYEQDRMEQQRGNGTLSASILPANQMRRWDTAVLDAATTAASISFTVETNAEPDAEDESPLESCTPYDRIDFERNTGLVLPDLWTAKQFRAEQPTTTHEEFTDTQIRKIARPAGITFNRAAGDSSRYNYSSVRADDQTAHSNERVDRDDLELEIVEPLFRMWWLDAILIEGYLDPAARSLVGPETEPPTPDHVWHWYRRKHVDPLKERKAEDTALRNGSLTLPRLYAEQGEDWERELEHGARALGISLEEYQALIRNNLFAGQQEASVEDSVSNAMETANDG